MKKRKYYPGVLACAAALVVVSGGIGKTWSYFTTYAEASGGYTIRLGDRTEISETFTEWTKHVVITNEESSEAVYIRVRAFCGSQYTIAYSGEGWTLGSDGYYYYSNAVDGGGATEVLDLKIGNIPENPEDRESFNVVVIYESTPVKYHEDGTAYTVEETDWSELLDIGSTESTGAPKETGSPEGEGSTGADSGEGIGGTGTGRDEGMGNTGDGSGEDTGTGKLGSQGGIDPAEGGDAS